MAAWAGYCARPLKVGEVVALVVRALMPMGWMPDAQAGITICSVDAKVQHDQNAPKPDAGHHDICPFSAAPQLASTPDAPYISAPVGYASQAGDDRAYAAVFAARFSPQAQRAPPLNA